MTSFKRNNLETSLGHIKQYMEQPMSHAVFGQKIGSTNLESGSAKVKISDLRFYGLLSSVKNKQRSFTDICEAMMTPVAPKKEKEAKARAFLFPEEFRKVYDQYKGMKIKIEGRILEEIANLLNRDLKYTEECMAVFRESGIFAGVLV